MAKPKGGTLAALWEVSDKERQDFFDRIQKRSTETLEQTAPNTGVPVAGTPFKGTPETGIPSQIPDRTIQDPELHISGIPFSGAPELHIIGEARVSDINRDQEPSDLGTSESIGIPVSGIPELPLQNSFAAPLALVEPSVRISGTPVSGISPVTGIPLRPSGIATPVRKIRRAVQVQDGHSLGEHLVLTTLWKDPAAVPVAASTKRITIGYRTLSEKCRLTVNNCKANLRSLQQKLAIEAIIAPSNSKATTYLVYDFAEIIRRREAAGMTHVIRSKGCLFVNPDTGQPITGIPGTGTAPAPASGIPPNVSGVPETAKTGVPGTGALLITKTETASKQTSSSGFNIVSEAAAQLGVALDDDAVRKLVRRCHDADPTATEDEIAHFLTIKIRQLQRSKTVSNLVGLLIASVPVFFGPPSTELTRYRESRAADARAAADREQQLVNEARNILDDPNASDNDKAMARSWLPDYAREGKS